MIFSYGLLWSALMERIRDRAGPSANTLFLPMIKSLESVCSLLSSSHTQQPLTDPHGSSSFQLWCPGSTSRLSCNLKKIREDSSPELLCCTAGMNPSHGMGTSCCHCCIRYCCISSPKLDHSSQQLAFSFRICGSQNRVIRSESSPASLYTTQVPKIQLEGGWRFLLSFQQFSLTKIIIWSQMQQASKQAAAFLLACRAWHLPWGKKN